MSSPSTLQSEFCQTSLTCVHQGAHTSLRSHLSRTTQEIFDQEKHMDQLAASIRSMGPPLKVAQTRLALRTSRPEVEACRDPPHHRCACATKCLCAKAHQ